MQVNVNGVLTKLVYLSRYLHRNESSVQNHARLNLLLEACQSLPKVVDFLAATEVKHSSYIGCQLCRTCLDKDEGLPKKLRST